jgi:hypothetical protein
MAVTWHGSDVAWPDVAVIGTGNTAATRCLAGLNFSLLRFCGSEE